MPGNAETVLPEIIFFNFDTLENLFMTKIKHVTTFIDDKISL